MIFAPRWHSQVREKWTLSAAVGRWLIVCGVVLSVGVLSFGATVLSNMRESERARALQSTANVATAIEGDIARNIELYDLSLLTIVDCLKLPEVQQMSPSVRQQILFGRATTANHLGGILVVDDKGNVIANSHNLQPRWNGYSHREYFRKHQDNPNLGLFIGRPFLSNSGKYVITLSRRLSRPDGSFAGVVVGALRVTYFQELFERASLGPNAGMGVYRMDGTLIARYPFREQDMRLSIGKTALLQQAETEPTGHLEATAWMDGIRRLYSYRRVNDLPLVVAVGIPTQEIYAWWRQFAWTFGLVETLLAVMTIGFAAVMSIVLHKKSTMDAGQNCTA